MKDALPTRPRPHIHDPSFCQSCERWREDVTRPCSCTLTDEQKRAANMRSHIGKAHIPSTYRWASFDAPELRERVKPMSAIEQARKAIDAPSIVLSGPAGSGKTSLAAAVLVERIKLAFADEPTDEQEHWRWTQRPRHESFLFVSTFGLAKARREHRLGDGEASIVEDAMSATVLLLDELGAEFGRDTTVQEIVHERHAHGRTTIYTTPFTLAEIEGKYGGGIARRVFERSERIELGGKK